MAFLIGAKTDECIPSSQGKDDFGGPFELIRSSFEALVSNSRTDGLSKSLPGPQPGGMVLNPWEIVG